MLDYTTTGVQSAQILLAETAKRIADYIHDHPVPPKDFNKQPKSIAPVANGNAAPSQTLGRYNTVDTGQNTSGSPNVTLSKVADIASPVADAGLKANAAILSDAAHPAALPEAIAEQVDIANNVIQFFKSKLATLSTPSSFYLNRQVATGILADLTA